MANKNTRRRTRRTAQPKGRALTNTAKNNKLNAAAARLGGVPLGVILACAYYVIIAVSCAVQAAFVDRDAFAYDLSMLRAIICMVVSVCAVWMLATRAERAPGFCCFGTIAFIVLSLVDVLFFGVFGEMAAAVGDAWAIALLAFEHLCGVAVVVYCVGSARLRAWLGEPVATAEPVAALVAPAAEAPLSQRIRTWPFWRNLVIYFIVFSMLGHWAEMLFCRLIILGVFMGDYDPSNAMLWDQWLFPFSAEGIALVMVVLVLHPLKERLLKRFNGRAVPAFIVSFLINQVVCTSIDFLTGMAVNQDYSLWDYRALPFNFMGQVCLQNSLVYTVAATAIVWWVYPAMDRFLHRIPKRYADGLFFALLGMYAFLAMLYFVVV